MNADPRTIRYLERFRNRRRKWGGWWEPDDLKALQKAGNNDSISTLLFLLIMFHVFELNFDYRAIAIFVGFSFIVLPQAISASRARAALRLVLTLGPPSIDEAIRMLKDDSIPKNEIRQFPTGD